RKRSFTTVSPSPASASSASLSSRDTSPVAFPYTFYHDTRMTGPVILSNLQDSRRTTSWGPDTSFANLHSRTQKRLRNNRPPEAEVYATTRDLLFSAAQSSQTISRSSHPSQHHTHSAAAPAQRQSSLHQFWSLPAPPILAPGDTVGPPPSVEVGSSKCEDCEGPLLSSSTDISMGGMELDPEYGAFDESELSCMGCGKMVCPTCAVVETGLGRECLECRTR
ncbi:MAG: hypothetical protein Q9210_005759, partial [Variospora velana]